MFHVEHCSFFRLFSEESAKIYKSTLILKTLKKADFVYYNNISFLLLIIFYPHTEQPYLIELAIILHIFYKYWVVYTL